MLSLLRKISLTLPLLLFPLVAFSAEKRTVCTVTINSSEEREVFEKRLPKNKFNFVELTDLGSPATPGSYSPDDWFQNACASGVSCDVLMISGHFGGYFLERVKRAFP